jgi:hypothetical protein
MRAATTLVLALLTGLSCCGYSARSLLPPHLNTVALVPTENTTQQPGLDDELDDILADAFNEDRNLRVASLDDADLVITVVVNSYSRAAAVYDDEQTITTYETRVSARVEAEDRVKETRFYEGTASGFITYSPDTRTEEEAATTALEELATEIVRLIITKW